MNALYMLLNGVTCSENILPYFELKEYGFKRFDALDGSAAMLKIAKEKDHYDKYICALLGKTELPLENGMYIACLDSVYGCVSS